MLYFIGILAYLCTFTSANISEIYLNEGLVPLVFDGAPTKELQVFYNGVIVDLNKTYSAYELRFKPEVIWEGDANKYYTLIILTPDTPSRKNQNWKNALLWQLVNIPGSDLERGQNISTYSSPAPGKNTGTHRLLITIHEQPNGFQDFSAEPYSSDRQWKKRLWWSAKDFFKRNNLTQPIFATMLVYEYDLYVDYLLKEYTAEKRLYPEDMPFPTEKPK